MTKELLLKFLDNRCKPEELEDVIRWINREESSSDEGQRLAFEDWRSFVENEQPEELQERLSQLLDKIHHRINISEQAKAEKPSREMVTSVIKWGTRVAAILLLPVLTFLIYLLSQTSLPSSPFADSVVDSLEITSPVGTRSVITLNDGTEVHLNSGSKIKYPRVFTGKTRDIKLSGEGYFDVAHDPDHPFIVQARKLRIKVLGTKFNVMVYPEDDVVATTLVDGKVVLEKTTSSGEIVPVGALKPGQHAEFNLKDETTKLTNGAVDRYIAWKDGLLIFDNASINEVATRLGRIFNVEIDIDNEIRDYTYTVKFTDESLPQILELLTKATPMKYRFLPRQKMPDGTFMKQRIIVEKQK